VDNVDTGTKFSDAATEQIEAEVRRRLCSAGYAPLRTIDCEYRDGMLVLRGRVPTYFYKQLAQSALLTHPLVKTLVNLIEVVGSSARSNGWK